MRQFYLSPSLYLLAVLMLVASAHAQDDLLDMVDAHFTASTDTVLIGEPFEITLEVIYPQTVELVEWPEIESVWTPTLEVLNRTEVETLDLSSGARRQAQVLTVVSWRVGEFSTPETFIGFQRIGEDRVYRVPVRSVTFSTPTILETKDLNQLSLRPNTPPIGFFHLSPITIGIGLVVVGTVGWFGGQWAINHWKQRRLERERAVALTALQEAVRQLQGALELNDEKETVGQFDRALRQFIERRFGISATDMTSTELVKALHASTLFPTDLLDDLTPILQHIDAVKYANASIENSRMERLHSALLQWLSAADGVGL